MQVTWSYWKGPLHSTNALRKYYWSTLTLRLLQTKILLADFVSDNVINSPFLIDIIITLDFFGIFVELSFNKSKKICENRDDLRFIFNWKSCWDELSHIDKLKMVCTLYKLLETFFPLPYDFGMVYISLAYEVCILVSLR